MMELGGIWIGLICLFLGWGMAVCAQAQSDSAEEEKPPVGEEAYEVLKAFYDYDASVALEARIVEKVEEAEGIRYKVVFRSARGFLVPGYLETPAAGAAPYPVVLLLHGWSGCKGDWWNDGSYISGGVARKALLEAGYAVFALDAQGHGDRIAENDYQVVNIHNEPGALVRKNYFTLREIIVQTNIDYRRALDYLATRDDIDMDRIGLLGYSMGGNQSISLAAVEPRIKVVVGCVVPATMSDDLVIVSRNYIRGLGDRPYLMLMGREDPMCSEAQAHVLYDRVRGERRDLIFYEAEHELPDSYTADALDWFKKHL